jgi:uncharacterized protein YbcI
MKIENELEIKEWQSKKVSRGRNSVCCQFVENLDLISLSEVIL